MKYKFKIAHLVPAFLFVMDVIYGGSKPPASMAPRRSSPPPRLAAPTVAITNWTRRGAWSDWRRVDFPQDFSFLVETNWLTSVTLMAWGEIRGRAHADGGEWDCLAALPSPVSVEPGASSVAHGLTPSNSYLFVWENCCVDRESDDRVSASIELFGNGSARTVVRPLVGGQGPVTNDFPSVPPPGFVGRGQDEDWIRATFPGECTNILAAGYADWLANEYVGVDAQNGHYQAAVTIAAMPADGLPCYLTCGPYRVNVVAPGTYLFPLEVFETYEVRTAPVAVPFSVEFDDGYTGEGASYEIIDETPRPRLLAGPSGGTAASLLTFYRFHLQPRVVVAPDVVRLSTANGTRVSFWCNVREGAIKTYRAVSRELYLTFFASQAEIHDAFVEDYVEIILELDRRECVGGFYIQDDGFDGDDDIFDGETRYSPGTNDCMGVWLTAVTEWGSTAPAAESTSVELPQGRSADVFVFMATHESGSDQYDDAFGWTVTANGAGGLQGASSVSSHVGEATEEIYGVSKGAALVASGHFAPPAGGALRLDLQCWAQNVGDEIVGTCVQIVVVPAD